MCGDDAGALTGGGSAASAVSRSSSRSRPPQPPSSRSRRREHVFICMFYPSAALNPAHFDHKVRSAARRRRRRARAIAASRHRIVRETLTELDGRGRTYRVLIATATATAVDRTSPESHRTTQTQRTSTDLTLQPYRLNKLTH